MDLKRFASEYATGADMARWARGVMKSREPDFIIGGNYMQRWFIIPRNADQARSALGVLEKHGHVVRLPNGAEIGGQRHREAWRIVGVE